MNDEKYMIEEYKSHLKAMISPIALFFCVLVVGFVLWDIAFSYVVYPLQRELNYIDQAGYSYVIESSNDCGSYSRMKKLDNIITFTNEQGRRINVNTYIPVDVSMTEGYVVQEGEIAVSQKIADRLGLAIGSKVLADYPIYDQPIEYVVKAILPFASDLYNAWDNRDFSYAIVGDNEILLKQAKGTWTYYLNKQEYDDFLDKEYSYIDRINMSDERDRLTVHIYVRYALMLLAILMLAVTIAVLMHKGINKEVLKYYYDGYEIRHVKTFDRRDHFLFFGVPCIVQMIWMTFAMVNTKGSFAFYLCALSALIVTLFITVFVGGIKYGKAN